MQLTRIKVSDITDERFCVIDEPRKYHNRDFRTLMLMQSGDQKKRLQVFNLLEVRNREVRQKLRFRYTDDSVWRPAVSMVQNHLDALSFGWADIAKGAPWMVLDSDRTGFSPARLAKWLKAFCSNDVLILEGTTKCRVSFSDDEDFILTRLQFA